MGFVPQKWAFSRKCPAKFLSNLLIVNTVPACPAFFLLILKKKKIIYIYSRITRG